MIIIRAVKSEDTSVWLFMRQELWPEDSEAEHREEIERFFADELPWTVLLAEDDNARVLGFVELSIRPYAEGCKSNKVAYLEGWFVRSEARNRGVGRMLVAAAENWGRSQGCTEFASDASPDNEISIAAHRSLGFADAGLVRCFYKKL